MKRQSGLMRLIAAVGGLLIFSIAVSAQHATVHLADDSVLTATTTAITGRLPVLFIHGHNDNLNYKKNWWDPLHDAVRNLPSFKQALDNPQNNTLGIEPYYIQFLDQDRSIDMDAVEIGDAIDLILHRHDPDHYPYPYNPAQTTNVKVVIIAYSKGTISAHQYLKSLQPPAPGQPEPRPGFRPASEFIAISPPNHGLSTNLFADTGSLAVKQLYNGMRPEGGLHNFQPLTTHCTDSFNETAATDYIANLNHHPIADSISIGPTDFFDDEAPGSRANTDQMGKVNPPTSGTLYVTLFANNHRDIVGGLTPSTDCPQADGRKLARNLAHDAINIEVPEIIGFTPVGVHENTVHTFEVICKALYAAVHHRSPESQTCASANVGGVSVPIIPPPTRAAAMLTLDFSGSMSAPAPPDPSRAAALQDAVALFIQLWSAVSVPSDRLGVTYFRTTVDQFHPANSSDPLPLLSASGNDIINDVRNQTPRDRTAMGGGLQQSIDTLRNPSVDAEIRRIILLTDGMQNVNPRVQTVGNDLVIADQPIPPGGPITVLDTLGIPIDTIGIGAGTTFVDLLRDIALRTGGNSLSTTDPGFDLRSFFVESLINALKGFSPQLVAYRHGTVGSRGSTEDFTIEDGPRKVVLEVSWKRGDSLDFSVAKDGVDVTSAGRFLNSATHKIFVIDLPAKGITARGNWQLRINGRSGTAYETAAIIDGERISYDAMFNVQRPRAGDALDLVLRLTADGQPIRGRVKVKVAWKSPTTTVGDIITKYKPKDPPAAEAGASAAERQILALAYDPKMWAALKPKTQTEVLKSNDKGEYRKQFRPKIPGVYTAVVTIEGDDAKLGKVSRTLTITTVATFANAKLKDRDVSISETPSASNLRNVSVVLFPRDKDGHRMGPGLSSNISLTSAGRKIGGIQDLGDGRYLMVLAPAVGEDPMIRLEVAGATLFSGPLSKLPRK